MFLTRTFLSLLGLWSPGPPPQATDRNTCLPHQLTKFKMVAGPNQLGQKFICPPLSKVKSCRCPVTMVDGSKTGLDVEVEHPNPRVCSCRGVTCGPACRKIVTRAVCCGARDLCPINSHQKPRHKKDWVCRIDVRRTFGMKASQIQAAVNVASDYLAQQPKQMVELYFRRGTYVIDNGENPAFTLKNIKPVNNGRLIISGAGMDATTIKVVDWKGDVFWGTNVTKLTIRDLHLTRSRPGVTQGTVTRVSKGLVTLEIPPGFPLPNQIYNGRHNDKTRTYLRRFTNIANPQLVMENNKQVIWDEMYPASQTNTRLWTFRLKYNMTVNYRPGHLIGVKSKCCGLTIPRSYSFKLSRELLFERVRWTRQTRGVFRLGTNDVTIRDCEIVRDPPINGRGWCMSSSEGGPQFGQPRDTWMHKVKVENFYAENTGDDSLAFFNVVSQASVTNVTIVDAFSRSVLLHKSPNIEFNEVKVSRSPICINNDLEDVRGLYPADPSLQQTPRSRSPRSRFVHDPDGLLGSNCTLQPEDFGKRFHSKDFSSKLQQADLSQRLQRLLGISP